MDALIFDFDGVVIDSEPIHLKCFQHVLAAAGIALTEQQYYSKYLGFDDHDCFAAAFGDNGRQVSEDQIAEMTATKSQMVKRLYAEGIERLPGAAELIGAAARACVPVAVVSGALRAEIELASARIGVLEHFAAIISPADVERGKPDPAGYRLGLQRLIAATGRDIAAGRCIAIEDSPAGIAAACGAALHVLGVTTSYPAQRLAQADRVVDSLADVSLESLDELLQ